MKKIKSLFIMPPAFAGLETLVPFIYRLNKLNWSISCAFWDPKDLDVLKQSSNYYNYLKRNSKLIHFNFHVKFSKMLITLYVLLFILFNQKPRIVFLSGFAYSNNFLFKILRRINRWKGIYYVLAGNNAPENFKFIEEYYLKGINDPTTRKFLGKDPEGKFEAYSPKDCFGTILLSSRIEDKKADIFGWPKNRQYTGFAKLTGPWLNYVKESPCFDNKLLETEKSFIVILAYQKAGYYLFDSEDESLILLKESIHTVRKYYRDILIVIKPKVYLNSSVVDWLQPAIEPYQDNRIVIDYTPVSFLATKTILTILNIPSTAPFDFVINEVPCIEHSRYSDRYYKIHPNGSYLSDFGVLKTSTMDELDSAIAKVKNGTFKIMNKSSLINLICHEDNNNVLNQL